MAERITVSLTGSSGGRAAGVMADVATLGPLGALALAFLVTERHRAVTRDELAEVLWGEDLPSTWEPSLRSVISRVRRRLRDAGLAEDVIAGGRGSYQLRLPEGAVVDVEEADTGLAIARDALATGDAATALRWAAASAEVAARPFLPGIQNLWVERRQARLSELRAQSLEVLAEAASATGDHAAAIAAAEAAVASQPLRESAHLRAMAVQAAAGNRAEALRAYERCRAALAEELGVFPSTATEAAYLALLEDEARPSGPAVSPPNNLGVELSSFVGRSEQLAAVEKLLGTTRLLTLLGPGGVGKTRLALRIAAHELTTYRDGVWLVELAPLAEPALLGSYMLAALGLAEEPGRTPVQSLQQHFADGQVLVVLDNCEHLSQACATMVKDLLATCDGLTVLATSREPVGIPGECLYPVPTLSVPEPAERVPEELWASEAVRLLVDRASTADPAFALTSENAAAVADLCRSLDGLPLAIELAAARARSLSVSEIAARLQDRFRLLVGRDRTAPGRHRTLQAAVDWSYEALPPAEQALFRRLAVFAGGFSLDAAEAVGGDGGGEADVLEDLAALVDKSLVLADRSGSATRYGLLETLRQYGLERLAVTGEVEAVRAQHLAWVCALAERAEPHLESGEQTEWLRTLDVEGDNVRAALDWAIASAAGDEGLRTAASLWRYWQVRSRTREGRRWLEILLASTPSATPELRAKALLSAGILATTRHDGPLPDVDDVRRLFEEALALRRQIGDQRGAAAALHGLGGLHWRQGEPALARDCFEETLAIGRELGETRLIAASLTNLAGVAVQAGFQRRALEGLDPKALYEESLPLWRELGDHYTAARVLTDLAGMASREGRYALASSLLRDAAEIQRQIGDRRGMSQTIKQLAGVATRQADLARARSLLEESLALKRELDDPILLVMALGELGDICLMAGDAARAAELYEEGVALSRPLPVRLPLYNSLGDLGTVALIQGRLADARRLQEEAMEIGRHAEDLEDAPLWVTVGLAATAAASGELAEAANLCHQFLERNRFKVQRPSWALAGACDVLAMVAARDGEWRLAATLTGAAEASRESYMLSLSSLPAFAQSVTVIEQELGAEYEQARLQGKALPLADVVALALSVAMR